MSLSCLRSPKMLTGRAVKHSAKSLVRGGTTTMDMRILARKTVIRAVSARFSSSSSSASSLINGRQQKQQQQQQQQQLAPVRAMSRFYNESYRSFSTAPVVPADENTNSGSGRTPFLLADIGEGIKEVELLTWFVKPGDTVQQFDLICEVQSDKATVEITSRYDGVVDELAGNVGDMMQVGHPLLYLAGSAGNGSGNNHDGSSSTAATSNVEGGNSSRESNSTQVQAPPPTRMLQDTKAPEVDERLSIPSVASHYHLKSDGDDLNQGNDASRTSQRSQHDNNISTSSASFDGDNSNNTKFCASPAVRKLGKEYNLDLSTIHGSGPRGRLLKSDVMVYLQEQGRMPSPSPPPPPPSTPQEQPTLFEPPMPQQQGLVGDEEDEYEVVQLKGYNRLMVQSMTKALKIPHMGFGDEIIVDKLMECRHDLNQQLGADAGSKLSLMAFLCKACSLALQEYPLLNAASVAPDETNSSNEDASSNCTLHVYKEHRLGIAVDTPRGLVVPVIRNVQSKSILEIQDDLHRFKELAAKQKLSAEELSIPPTFTLSNIGALGCGGLALQPVIVPPQVAMGAMGRIQKLPRYMDENDDDDVLQPVHVMQVTWAGDHRYLDGATLARFHQRFSYYLQNPSRMLLHLK